MSTIRKSTTSGSAMPMVMAGTTMVAHSHRLRETVHGENVLVIADAFSKWLDVYATQSATTEATLEKY